MPALLGWGLGPSASKVDLTAETVDVTRVVDGGLDTVKLYLPAAVSTDLRLNKPCYVKLTNIMATKANQVMSMSSMMSSCPRILRD